MQSVLLTPIIDLAGFKKVLGCVVDIGLVPTSIMSLHNEYTICTLHLLVSRIVKPSWGGVYLKDVSDRSVMKKQRWVREVNDKACNR